MTNSEKAREIALSIRFNVKGNEWIFTAIEEYCKSMAEWKDHQFKEYLEEKRNHYDVQKKSASFSNDYKSCVDCVRYDAIITALDIIINELFPNEEKADYSDNDE